MEAGLNERLHLAWVVKCESWAGLQSDKDVVRVDVDFAHLAQ